MRFFVWPGGPARQIDVITDWDVGNVIASLEEHVQDLLDVAIDWMSYVGDWLEGDALCRVYGRPLEVPPALRAADGIETRWLTEDELNEPGFAAEMLTGFEGDALQRWLHEPIRRGIGLSQQRAGLKG
ncbi:MAG: hypothetical protein CMJ18_22515 [Phycisphaeraceae bacterium]|nr:hypothetical protein [Phycisphaeraceae bacterium]